MVTHTFNPSTLRKQRQVDLCKFEASLVYMVGYRPARSTLKNPVLSKKKERNESEGQWIYYSLLS